jgi:CheY-like chemotaxis protein
MDNRKNRVLIVDDEKMNLELLSGILRPDYAVYMAKNGPTAIEITNKCLPDIILLDVLMPDMNGFEVFEALKASDTTRHIPVIFITGLDSVEDEEKGLDMGAADFIHKPFSVKIVQSRVRNQMQFVNWAKMSPEIRTPPNAIPDIPESQLKNEPSPEPKEPKEAKKPQIEFEAIPNGRVLVVDDKDMSLYIAKGMLSLYGLQIDTAKSGHEAIEKIKYNVYDLVLIDHDHLMPGMDGMETTRAVRKFKGAYEKLPIVALTANTVADMKEMFLANGFNGFISKPIVLREMDKILKEWLSPEKISRHARANSAVIDNEAYNRFVASTMCGSPPKATEQLRENKEKALTAA